MAQQLPLLFEFKANKTFDDFFPGINQEVVNHLKLCLAGTGESFIFLFGKSGHGKSHLLQACCHQAQKQKQQSFYFDLGAAKLPDPLLLSGLDEYDVVCLDSIEQITGINAWEQAFFNFFNQCRDCDHKLIVSASSPPNALAIQLPDLMTRLNWGLTLKLKPLPDTERIAAMIFKADRLGFEIAPQTGRFLLSHFNRNPESLWTLLDTLDLATLAAQRKLTVPFLKEILAKPGHES